MSRKNMIGISENLPREEVLNTLKTERPIAGFVPAVRGTGPVGGITRTLGNITGKIERAELLERQLVTGQLVVEIDPDLIDSSFISDRLEINDEELSELTEQVREHGQLVPILVRPHPIEKDRYQVAYGHRRLAVAKKLSKQVRAIVRALSDDELVVSQGQENNSRKDLSYIERALFAARLEDRNFSRETIMSALGMDKTALSRMIAVVRQVPIELVMAIGAAPNFGRRRWMELAELVAIDGKSEQALVALGQKDMRALTSDQRFQAVFDSVQTLKNGPKNLWQSADNSLPVKFKRTGAGATFVFDGKSAPGFDEFVKGKLSDLYAEYRKTTGD